MKAFFRGPAILLIILMITVTAGCSSKSSAYNAPALNGATSGTANAIAGTQDKAAGSKNESPTSSSQSSTAAPPADSRKIIMSANISLQTTTYDKAVSSLEAMVTQYGGFVQDSSTQGTGKSGSDRSASYTVRVPASKLDSFIAGVGGLGKVISKSKKGEDVTQNYYDTEARLASYKAEKAQILDILSKTTNMNDVLSIVQKLSDIDYQIESLTGSLQKWDSLVELSTVTIRVEEVIEITNPNDDFGGQVLSVLKGSLKGLISTFKVILMVIVAILPFVIVLGIIAAVVIIIVRLRRRHKTLPPASKTETQPETEPDK